MWDIFNKETVNELRATVKDLESKLSSKEREVQKLDAQLTNQISKTTALTQESEKRISELIQDSETNQRALDAVLDELRAFLIQNREKNLHYDCLEATKELIDDFADVNEYTILLQIELKNINSRAIRRNFFQFILALHEEKIISSYRVELDQPVVVNRGIEEYKAVVILYSIESIQKIENLLLQLLHRRRVAIHKNYIENGKKLIVLGSMSDRYY